MDVLTQRSIEFPASYPMATITTPETSVLSSSASNPSRNQIFDAFRRWGYLQAHLDPLGQHLPPVSVAELQVDGPDAEEARAVYCGTVAAEFMHIPDGARRAWIQGPA